MKKGKLLGELGEAKAAEFLKAQGYRILKKNHRIAGGELDLIAQKGEFIVFVEVKSRRVGRESINPRLQMTKKKLAQVRKLAECYLLEKEISDLQPRFDFLGISLSPEGRWEVEHIENAF